MNGVTVGTGPVAGAQNLHANQNAAKSQPENDGHQDHDSDQPERADQDIGNRRRVDRLLYDVDDDRLRSLYHGGLTYLLTSIGRS